MTVKKTRNHIKEQRRAALRDMWASSVYWHLAFGHWRWYWYWYWYWHAGWGGPHWCTSPSWSALQVYSVLVIAYSSLLLTQFYQICATHDGSVAIFIASNIPYSPTHPHPQHLLYFAHIHSIHPATFSYITLLVPHSHFAFIHLFLIFSDISISHFLDLTLSTSVCLFSRLLDLIHGYLFSIHFRGVLTFSSLTSSRKRPTSNWY
jgi:hypothetical protein